jgi:PTH1 family peptidyl-tRNA hydrolase
MSAVILAGLGNPGAGYAGNRHNIGFMVIDRLVSDYGFSRPALKFGGSLCEGQIGLKKIYAFKPLGYMNTSGGPIGQLCHFYKLPPESLITFHDELDLEPGQIRVKTGGGHGGHNGLKSIDAHLGQNYKRVRIGIGHPGHKDLVSDYVLSDFSKGERAFMEQIVCEISRHVGLLIQGDDAGFMNKISVNLPKNI